MFEGRKTGRQEGRDRGREEGRKVMIWYMRASGIIYTPERE